MVSPSSPASFPCIRAIFSWLGLGEKEPPPLVSQEQLRDLLANQRGFTDRSPDLETKVMQVLEYAKAHFHQMQREVKANRDKVLLIKASSVPQEQLPLSLFLSVGEDRRVSHCCVLFNQRKVAKPIGQGGQKKVVYALDLLAESQSPWMAMVSASDRLHRKGGQETEYRLFLKGGFSRLERFSGIEGVVSLESPLCGYQSHKDFSWKWCYVLPYFNCKDLLELINAQQPPSSQELLQIADFLIQVVARLHRNGIVHGDIKLENVLVHRTESQELQLALTDCDFAQSGISDPKKRYRDASHGMYSFGWSPPEQIEAEIKIATEGASQKIIRTGQQLFARDIYSLGMLLAVLLNLQVKERTKEEEVSIREVLGGWTKRRDVFYTVIDQICEKEGSCFTASEPWFQAVSPTSFEVLILSMLHPNPDSRPQAQEILEVFSSFNLVS